MAYLKRDRNGRIYEASPDMANGGFKGYPVPVKSQVDPSLGNAISKSLNDIKMMQQSTAKANQVIDESEWARGRIYDQYKKKAAKIDRIKDTIMQHPEVQRQLVKAAVMQGYMGCGCEMNVGLSGYGLTFNGQMGEAGLTDNQKAIRAAATGGYAKAPGPSKSERDQFVMKQQAEALYRMNAGRKVRDEQLGKRREELDKKMKKSKAFMGSTPSPLQKYFNKQAK